MIIYQKKYNNIWNKVSADIKKKNLIASWYNYLKTKTKPHGNEVTDIYDKKYPTLDSNYTCLAAIGLDSAFKKDDSYYPQVFLKECKYIDEKLVRHIHANLSDFCYSSDESEKE